MRMLSAAHRKISSTGIHSKSGRTSAMLRAKKDSTQKKMNSVVVANTARKSQATVEEKNSWISFCAIRRIAESVAIGIRLPKQTAEIASGLGQGIQLRTAVRHATRDFGGGIVGLRIALQIELELPATGGRRGLLHGGHVRQCCQRLAKSHHCRIRSQAQRMRRAEVL